MKSKNKKIEKVIHFSKQTFDHLDAENSLTEIARCPYIKGETQYAHCHHGFIASVMKNRSNKITICCIGSKNFS
jgi:hypothetical protein